MRHHFHARHEVTSFMTSLQFLLFALRVTLNVVRFRNKQASLCYFYFVFIIVIKKITDPQNIVRFLAHPVRYISLQLGQAISLAVHKSFVSLYKWTEILHKLYEIQALRPMMFAIEQHRVVPLMGVRRLCGPLS